MRSDVAKCSVWTLDNIFSKCVRERSDYVCEYEGCEYCQNHSFRPRPGGLHCSHFKGRRNRSTRWHPDNCFALCHKRHERMGDNPDEHAFWVRRKLGEPRFDELVLRGNGVRKYTPADRAEMNAHYRAQLKYLERRRRDGETGYLDIVSWD